MLGRCANCNSAMVTAGLDGYSCSECGAYTIDGVAKRVTTGNVETVIPHVDPPPRASAPEPGLTSTESMATKPVKSGAKTTETFAEQAGEPPDPETVIVPDSEVEPAKP